jgi:hypothetical protein
VKNPAAKIPSEAIIPAPSFHMDPVGSVFRYQGEVYRGIRSAYEDFYRRLVTSDFFPELVNLGLVDTRVADFTLDGFALVLRHKKIEFESVWGEWCSLMIKDATVFMLELSLGLAKHGLFLNDIKPGNILFDSTRPVWIDLGAVVPIESVSPRRWLRRFWQNSLFPLWLMSRGMGGLGRLVYREVPNQGLQAWIARRPIRWFPLYYRALVARCSHDNLVRTLEKLLHYVMRLKVRPESRGWIAYREGRMPPVTQPDSFNLKQKNVYDVLKSLPRGTLMDMGCNKAWYAELAATLGYQVVAFDTDDETICHVYRKMKAAQLPVLPLVMDFAWPRASFGLGLAGRDAIERLRCDVTLGLALVHHLVFFGELKFETIAWMLDRYTKSCAIVDFPPKEDISVSKWMRAGFQWYTLDNFMAALRKYFPSISIYESDPAPRRLLVCKKNQLPDRSEDVAPGASL